MEFSANVRAAGVIVIGTVTGITDTAEDESRVRVKPEAFLKGPPSASGIQMVWGFPGPCEGRGPRVGGRILLFLSQPDRRASWPEPEGVFFLEDGKAATAIRGVTEERTEQSLIDQIRAQTNQLSRPASGNDGAGIDWGSTIIPIGIACVGLMGVGLFLMRIWHRIDPS